MIIFNGNTENLEQDRNSGFIYGELNQLTVLGFIRKDKYKKKYIVSCSICCKDAEIYNSGVFSIDSAALALGTAPCGCAQKVHYSEDQYTILCKRKADELGYEFRGWVGDYNKVFTYLRLYCPKHGEWTTTQISTLLSYSAGCLNCGMSRQKRARAPTLEQIVDKIFSTGKFHEDTKFSRSDRLTRAGLRQFLIVECPVCGTVSENYIPNLYKGRMSCPCSGRNQVEAYIHIIYDNELPIAIKFGISNNYEVRLETLRGKNSVDLVVHGVWKFPDRVACVTAESDVKREVERPVLDRQRMPDGFSETTHLFNIDKVIEIYERNGGQRIENL